MVAICVLAQMGHSFIASGITNNVIGTGAVPNPSATCCCCCCLPGQQAPVTPAPVFVQATTQKPTIIIALPPPAPAVPAPFPIPAPVPAGLPCCPCPAPALPALPAVPALPLPIASPVQVGLGALVTLPPVGVPDIVTGPCVAIVASGKFSDKGKKMDIGKKKQLYKEVSQKFRCCTEREQIKTG
ncbi:hypothetical protein NECAME_12500 [Necator americanus]|uniref:Uncharacterized protein n=1 Tax=Necator americanus TaxID=51031 RepID=W2T2V6_NECAM|nr:hypothetical protein NECAME_12500 [Necator americanus]ETN75292.1 hypothetical protein NECAME_12500 [Necator americanus]